MSFLNRKPLTKAQIIAKLKEINESDKATLGFCQNSRRWLLLFEPSREGTCPHAHDGCQYDKCGYYKEREPNKHIIAVLQTLRWGTGK